MSNLLGFRQASSLDFLESLREAAQSEEERQGLSERRKGIKARAHAQVCHSLGINLDEMTEAHKKMAEALEKRLTSGGTEGKGFGFSIDPTGRKPNWR